MSMFGNSGGMFGSQRGYQLTPEEEEDLLSSLERAGLSTLAYIGESIDKPMAALRGLLAGRPEELANIIPFSDALGITSSEGLFGGSALQVTDDEDTVYGRDLLETWGLADENVDGLGGSDWSSIDYGDAMADIAGFGIDLLGVPMAGPANALSKAGRLGRAAGLTDEAAAIAKASGQGGITKYRVTNTLQDALNDVAGSPMIGKSQDDLMASLYRAGGGMGMDRAAVDAVMGERLGSSVRFAGLGLPEKMDRAVASGFDSALGAMGNTGPGRVLRQAFDRGAAGTGNAPGQDFLGPRWNLYQDQAELAARRSNAEMASIAQRNKDILSRLGDGNENMGWYRVQETRDINELRNRPGIVPEDWLGIEELRKVKGVVDAMPDRAGPAGVSFNKLIDDEVDYMSRQVQGMKPSMLSTESKLFSSEDPSSQLFREDFLKDMPGGTAELMDIAMKTADGEWEDIYAAAQAKLQPRIDAIRQQLGDTDLMKQQARGERTQMRSMERAAERESLGPQRQLDSLERQRARQLEKMADLGPREPLEPAEVVMRRLAKMQERATQLQKEIDQASVFGQLPGVDEAAGAGARIEELDGLLEGIAQNKKALASQLEVFEAKPAQIADFYQGLKPEIRAAGVYGNPMEALARRNTAFEKSVAGAESLTDTFADLLNGGKVWELSQPKQASRFGLSRLAESLGIKPPANEKTRATIQQAISSLGLDGETGLDAIYRKLTPEAMAQMGLDGADLASLDLKTLQQVRQTIGSQYVPELLAEDLGRLKKTMQGPDPTSLMKDAAVQYNRWWKALQTNPWVNFHVRNFGSGQVREALAGNNTTGELGMINRLMSGKDVLPEEALAVPGVRKLLASQGLPETEAANVLRQLFHTYMPTQGQGISLEDLGQEYTRVADVAENIRNFDTNVGFVGGLDGTAPTGFKDALDALRPLVPGSIGREARAVNPDWYRPGAIRGLAGRDKTRFAPVAAGEIAGEAVENLNRLPSFVNQLKRGIDPEQAMRNVNRTQIDYSTRAFTPFENELRRLGVMPFYSFSSRNIPYVASELLNNPSGRTGTMFRGLSSLRSDDEFLPEHIAQTLAIPLGRSEEGDPRYLTGLGLMEEDLLGPFDPSNPFKSAGYEAMGRLSPLLKAPIEYVLGKSLFQSGYGGARDTEDMDPQLGRFLSNIIGIATGEDQRDAVDTRAIEPLLQIIPGIRALSTARQVTDTRKLEGTLLPADALILNLLTGSKISDVTPAAEDASLQDMIANQYKAMGGRDFQNYYIPESVKETMTPEELLSSQRLRALLSSMRKRREARQQVR